MMETTQFHSLITHTRTHIQCGKYVAHDTLTHRQSLKNFYKFTYKLKSSCLSPFSRPSSTWARERVPGNEHGKG